MAPARQDVLNGWKEIAAYVARDIRTVERWEKQRGLPVRRVPGEGRATVYAHISELEQWLTGKPLEALEREEAAEAEAQPPATPALSDSAAQIAAASREIAGVAEASPAQRRSWWLWLAAAGVCCAAMAVVLWVIRHRSEDRARAAAVAADSTAKPGVPYRSIVAGTDELYLRGEFYFEQRTPDSLERAMKYYSAAAERDPRYAPAYSGEAKAWVLLREYSNLPDDEGYAKGKAAAEHALSLDPNLAEAHATLGFIDFFWLVDPNAADAQFQTAIAHNPALAQAHHWYGSVLTHQGRYTDALHELDTALHLAPTSSAILVSRALALALSGQKNQARAQLEEMLQQEAEGHDEVPSTIHRVLGIISMLPAPDVSLFLSEQRRVAQMRHDTGTDQFFATAEATFRTQGERAMWTEMLKKARTRSTPPGALTMQMVGYEALLGEKDKAFADLDQLESQQKASLVGLRVDPLLIPLHSDPRYLALCRKLGFVPPAE